jgi:Leucine-rich repeat (LRR) protein
MFCAAFASSNLHTLSVAWSPLEDCGPISLLTTLQNLSLQSTRINSVAPLSALVNLTYLDVSGLR